MARCASCGAELPDYYTSCPNCGGTQVVRNAAPQPQPSAYIPMEEQRVVYSTGQWIGWILLCSFLPLIGIIIMMCVAKDPSAKNYAKLMLILTIIAIVLEVIVGALVLVPAYLGYVERAREASELYGMMIAFIR